MTDRPARFAAGDLEELRRTREVRIVTGPQRHRTIIWVVVDDHDRVLVRSVRGPRGRWYREAIADPRVALELGGHVVSATAQLADDAGRIEAASEGLRRKYRTSAGSLVAMLRPETLATTIELRPA